MCDPLIPFVGIRWACFEVKSMMTFGLLSNFSLDLKPLQGLCLEGILILWLAHRCFWNPY